MENRFNLIDEPWIAITSHGKASLKDIFTRTDFQSLGGNPIQKIVTLKLLLAIAQAAATPENEGEWKTAGAEGMAQKCLAYLEKWHDRFYLYGDKPFLQMPAIAPARALSLGAFSPSVATGNATVLTKSHIERDLSDADKALTVLMQMNFALSGKKTDNSVVLSAGYQGKYNASNKPSSGKAGPSVGHLGFLHSFILTNSIIESVWLNLFALEHIESTGLFTQGIGVAPWENMPEGEDCPTAQDLKNSYMGRLISLCRFCLLTESGMHYSEGISHKGYKDGIQDLSIAVNRAGKEPRALWSDPEKRPWRELTSLLSFFDQTSSQGFECWQIKLALDRTADAQEPFSIWSGGLRVSANAGEQYVSGSNDIVESQFWLESGVIDEHWFALLKLEVSELETLSKNLYGRVLGYFKMFSHDGAKTAAQATSMFWQLCENDFQSLLVSCDVSDDANKARYQLRRKFSEYQHQVYDFFCPKQTARQIDAWAKNKPNNYKYVTQEQS